MNRCTKGTRPAVLDGMQIFSLSLQSGFNRVDSRGQVNEANLTGKKWFRGEGRQRPSVEDIVLCCCWWSERVNSRQWGQNYATERALLLLLSLVFIAAQ